MLSENQINLLESQGFTKITVDFGACRYYTYHFNPVNNIYLRLTVELYNGKKVSFKDKLFYTLQVKTLDSDEIDTKPVHGFNGAYLEKGLYKSTTFDTIKLKYGITE